MYEYHGCHWHGCETCYPDNRDVGKPSFKERRQNTEDKETYIRAEGYKLVTMWACQWKVQRKQVLLSTKYLYPTENKYRLSEKEIIKHINTGQIFGAVECDISVPPHLQQHFSDFPPIFKNTSVTIDDIGKHMSDYLKDTGQTFKPTRYLIGSMKAEKALFITPLLQWYVNNGLVITKVYQVIEFAPKRCFECFATQVSDDRRSGKQVISYYTYNRFGSIIYGGFKNETNYSYCNNAFQARPITYS